MRLFWKLKSYDPHFSEKKVVISVLNNFAWDFRNGMDHFQSIYTLPRDRIEVTNF